MENEMSPNEMIDRYIHPITGYRVFFRREIRKPEKDRSEEYRLRYLKKKMNA